MEIQPIPFTRQDLGRIAHLQPEGWSDITPHMKYYTDHSFCHPLKTESGGGITGLGALIMLGDSAWLAHIIVNPDFRKQGIGGAIVSALLNIADLAGIPSALLTATEMGKPVYQKAGFREVGEYTFFERKSETFSESLSSSVIPFHENYRTRLLNLDRQVSGEDRSRILEPCLAESALYVRNGQLMGYFVPGLKEGPIVATTEEAGTELMKLKYRDCSKAVLPANNIMGTEWLLAHGFEITSMTGTRMVRGKDVMWMPERIYSRIGGNLG